MAFSKRKMLCSLLASCGLLAIGEVWARGILPASSTTIFRNSALEDLDVELRPDFEVLYQGHMVRIHEGGFRGPGFPAHEPGNARIALVGDSVTFGNGIGWEDTLGVVLEQACADLGQEAEVLNFGVPGYNINKIASTLEHRALPEKPTQVVYLAYPNDHLPLPDFGQIDPEHKLDNLKGFPLRSALAEWLLSHAKDLARDLGRPLESRTPDSSREEWKTFGRDKMKPGLERMKALCDGASIKLTVVIHPFMLAPTQNAFRPLELAYAELCRELGIEVLMLEEAFAERDPRSLWAHPRFDSHPNGEANRLSAAWLAARLTQP